MGAVAAFFLVGLCVGVKKTNVTKLCTIIPTRSSIAVTGLLVQRVAQLGLTGLVIRIVVSSSIIFCKREGARQVGVTTSDETKGHGPADLTPLTNSDAVLEIPVWV